MATGGGARPSCRGELDGVKGDDAQDGLWWLHHNAEKPPGAKGYREVIPYLAFKYTSMRLQPSVAFLWPVTFCRSVKRNPLTPGRACFHLCFQMLGSYLKGASFSQQNRAQGGLLEPFSQLVAAGFTWVIFR